GIGGRYSFAEGGLFEVELALEGLGGLACFLFDGIGDGVVEQAGEELIVVRVPFDGALEAVVELGAYVTAQVVDAAFNLGARLAHFAVDDATDLFAQPAQRLGEGSGEVLSQAVQGGSKFASQVLGKS